MTWTTAGKKQRLGPLHAINSMHSQLCTILLAIMRCTFACFSLARTKSTKLLPQQSNVVLVHMRSQIVIVGTCKAHASKKSR
jgi:hypothetical protein